MKILNDELEKKLKNIKIIDIACGVELS